MRRWQKGGYGQRRMLPARTSVVEIWATQLLQLYSSSVLKAAEAGEGYATMKERWHEEDSSSQCCAVLCCEVGLPRHL